MQNWLKNNWIKLLAILAVLGALTNYFPLYYYQLMNWVVVIAAAITAKQAKKENNLWVAWLFVAVAVLFNPIAPIYLAQDVWRILDIIVAVIFALSFLVVKPKSE